MIKMQMIMMLKIRKLLRHRQGPSMLKQVYPTPNLRITRLNTILEVSWPIALTNLETLNRFSHRQLSAGYD